MRLDSYDGAWTSGGPDTYCEKIDRFYNQLQKPIILMEFGFAFRGGMMENPEIEAAAFLKKLGFQSIQDETADVDAMQQQNRTYLFYAFILP